MRYLSITFGCIGHLFTLHPFIPTMRQKKQTKQCLYIQYKDKLKCMNISVCIQLEGCKAPTAWAGETKTWQHRVTQTDGSHPECNLSRLTLGLLLISDARPTAWFFHQEALSMPKRKWDTCCEVCKGKSQIRKLTLHNTNECLHTHAHTHTSTHAHRDVEIPFSGDGGDSFCRM